MKTWTKSHLQKVVEDCKLAAKCLEETSTFPSGQSILKDVAVMLLDMQDEIEYLEDVIEDYKSEVYWLKDKFE